jgi:hypothetical protein
MEETDHKRKIEALAAMNLRGQDDALEAARAEIRLSRGQDLAGHPPVNKQYLLNRGWTRKAIKQLLGEPDRKIKGREEGFTTLECVYELARVAAAEALGPVRYRRASNSKVHCEQCGRFLKKRASTGRCPKFCSSRCRVTAHRMKRNAPAMPNPDDIYSRCIPESYKEERNHRDDD